MNMAVGGVIILFVHRYNCFINMLQVPCVEVKGRAKKAGASAVSGHPEKGNLNYPGKDQSRGSHQQTCLLINKCITYRSQMVLYDLTLCHACMWPNFGNFIQPLPTWVQRKGNFFFRVVQVACRMS